jgi:arylsulfatase A-like enzyme
LLVGKWHLVSDPTGFDDWDILQGQGTYYNPLMIRRGKVTQQTGYTTDLITDHALDLLKHRNLDKPFLLMCHHKATHRAWEPALRDLEFDADRQYPEPDTLFDDYAARGTAEHEQKMTLAKHMLGFDVKLTPPTSLNDNQRKVWDEHYNPRIAQYRNAKPQGRDLVRWKYQRYLHDYLACVKSLDDNVGRVLKYLDDEGLTQNTIVVYSSDQGFFMGEHGWFDKRWIFEESLRTPLLIRWPATIKSGTDNHDMVSNLDFAETFLDAAHIDIPSEMQGRSLLPLMQGNTPQDWRKSFYYQYFEYPEPHNVSPHYGIVTNRFKLVHFYDNGTADYWEFFDREKDPQEMRSVWGEAEYSDIQRQLNLQLDELRRSLKVPAQDAKGAHGN